MQRTGRLTAGVIAVAVALFVPAVAGADPPQGHDIAPTPVIKTTDLVPPDARDAERELTPTRVRIVEIPTDRFTWSDAVIGAAGTLALVLSALAVGLVAAHRRRSRHTSVATQ